MKAAIHPQYFPAATVHCSGCDTTYTVGSTAERIDVELCSNCHPFYTGKQKLVDTAGRVDRFRARQAKAKSAVTEAPAEAAVAPEAAAAEPAEPTTEDRLSQMKQQLEGRSSDAPAAEPAASDQAAQ